MKQMINPGFNIQPTTSPLGFNIGDDCFGPTPELRTLDSIRASLLEPDCKGPDIVYAIVMDVGKKEHKQILNDMHLLYGAVSYASGRLGKEPVRSQGHIHKISPLSAWSTPEVYEIWQGKAIILMQESAKDNPGRCFAVYANPGDVVIVPPNWAHCTISADPTQPLTFGAWCDRDFGFEYDDVRKRKGLAWYPIFNEQGELEWLNNPNYKESKLHKKSPEKYTQLGINEGFSLYTQFEKNPNLFSFVPHPQKEEEVWKNFIP